MLDNIKTSPQTLEFDQIIAYIDNHYIYKPTSFSNGGLVNQAGENEGSCKILAFAKLHNLSEVETLQCFGRYYREDVLKYPEGSDHQNIRHFLMSGWSGVNFDGGALVAKAPLLNN